MAKGRRSKKKNKRKTLDIQVAVLVIAAILLAVLIYTKSGYIGETFSPILGGIMGWIKYIIPIGMIAIAIFLAKDQDKEDFSKKIFQYAVLLLCITTVITIIQVSRGELTFNMKFEEVIKQAYYQGTKNKGGGAVGAIFAFLLSKLLGKVGAVIVAIGIAIVNSIFLFGLEPAKLLKDYLDNREEKKKEYKEDRLERRKHAKLEEEARAKRSKFNEDKNKENNMLTEDQINIKIANAPEEKKEINDNGLFKKEEEQKVDNSKEVLVLEHALTVEDENYEFPPITFLKAGKMSTKLGKKMVTDTANKLQKTLYSFGVSAKVENVSVGPTITRYELKPAEGVRVSKIANLADDIALSLAAETIRIEAPIPGKQAVGIEIPNPEKEVVALRDIIDSNEFTKAKSKLSFALGKNASGEPVVTDIAKMPHVLIAGSTGSR